MRYHTWGVHPKAQMTYSLLSGLGVAGNVSVAAAAINSVLHGIDWSTTLSTRLCYIVIVAAGHRVVHEGVLGYVGAVHMTWRPARVVGMLCSAQCSVFWGRKQPEVLDSWRMRTAWLPGETWGAPFEQDRTCRRPPREYTATKAMDRGNCGTGVPSCTTNACDVWMSHSVRPSCTSSALHGKALFDALPYDCRGVPESTGCAKQGDKSV